MVGAVADFPFAVFATFGIDVEAREDIGEVEGEGGDYLWGEVLRMWEWTVAEAEPFLCILTDALDY